MTPTYAKATLAAALSLLVCACLPTPPGAGNAYEGLTRAGQAPTGAASQFPIAGRGRSIGVVASGGTEKSLAYLEEAVNKQRTSPLLNSHYRPGNEAFKKPSYLFDTAMSLLRQRFGRVVQISDLNQAKGLDYVAVLDLNAALPTPMSHVFAYELKLEVLNGQLQKIGTISGTDSQPMTSDCYGWGDSVIDCGVNKNVTAIRNTADAFRGSFAAAVR
jgi:hypothetical protein